MRTQDDPRLKIPSKQADIKKAHINLLTKLKKTLPIKIKCKLGFQGGDLNGTVYYSKTLNIWFCHQKLKDRYWNAFGMDRPIQTGTNSITCEINIPFLGVNKKLGGAIATDSSSNMFLLHRGNIGGGRRGIGKQTFSNYFRGVSHSIEENGKESTLYEVANLNSKSFGIELRNFVNQVHEIKNLKIDQTSHLDSQFKFNKEHFGSTKYKTSKTIEINRMHGLVVNELKSALNKKKYKVGNNKLVDLFIHDHSTIQVLFEVKTTTNLQSLYTMTGQLLFNSSALNRHVRLIGVIPKPVNADLNRRLKALGIETLYYDFKNYMPQFKGIDKILDVKK